MQKNIINKSLDLLTAGRVLKTDQFVLSIENWFILLLLYYYFSKSVFDTEML